MKLSVPKTHAEIHTIAHLSTYLFLACLPTQKKPHMNYSCPDMFNISYSKSHLKCCSSSKESSTLLQTVAKVQIQINSYYYFSKLQLEKEKFCDLNFSYLSLDDCVPNETQCLKSSQKMVRWSLWNIFPDITRICKCSFWRLFQLWTPIFFKNWFGLIFNFFHSETLTIFKHCALLGYF